MRGLWGWFQYYLETENERQYLISSIAQDTPIDGSATFTQESMAIAGHLPYRTLIKEQNGMVITIAGYPYWDDRPLQQEILNILANDIQRNGIQALSKLTGSFVLSILDSVKKEAFFAVDRYGTYSLCYTVVKDSLIFGPTPAEIAMHPIVNPEIENQSIYNYLYFNMIPAPETIYKGIYRLPPGQVLYYRQGKTEIQPYWHYQFKEHESLPSQSDLGKTLQIILKKAVDKFVREENSVGAFLSGGTDSSTVAGFLGEVTGQPARTYSIGFAADGYDETNYARIAARHFNTDHHEYYVTAQDIVTTIPKIAHIYGQPFGNSSVVPTYFCAKLAKEDDVSYLLGGDGGDELFGGNSRYAKQWLFSLYGKIPKTLKDTILEPITQISLAQKIPGFSKVGSYIEQAKMPMPDRLESYNSLNRIGIENIFSKDFLSSINPDAPLQQLRSLYDGVSAQQSINRMLGLDLRITIADNDLPKVIGMCNAAGIDVGFPMLDEELGDFAACLPAHLKVKRTHLRYFYKEALRGFLPDEIIAKKKHGFGLPFGIWLKEYQPLHTLVSDSLANFRDLKIIQPSIIDNLIGIRLKEHAAYYGDLVWVLVILVQWMQYYETKIINKRKQIKEKLLTLKEKTSYSL
ncbi:asparagine synthetase B family protein [Candidatus Nitrosacidococcus sp. I8]|uniref:asparagine synthetase B family protein n=1 Tax=Candidatus Nitrosacidococcus sp. I8 TaxID=2942908 RepID=UPI002226DDB3|nr:asparagine synthase-related protein [Candidatus Nitrosacidococcus sp. I8]CAH9019181.1 Asparagine synthetase [glutamine-hydrolyzing] 1 [Candidatus Nitrosacidococcus sp. I8]